MTDNERLLKRLCWSAQRALEGQTPSTLRAYSFEIDHSRKRVLLRAHFGDQPSDDDLEAIGFIETEIDADFFDDFEGETDTEIVSPEQRLSFLPGGIAYLREGEPGTPCSWK